MFDSTKLDEITDRLINKLPPGFTLVKDDLKKNFHAVLQSTFSKLDLVSREEFEVQSAVLARSRAKLELLEKQVATLEAQLSKH
jgi:BMFP domain-containing protein YqiC